MSTPDELADALFTENYQDLGVALTSQADLRILARAAAKEALEEFANERDPIGPDDAINRALRTRAEHIGKGTE